MAAAEAVGGLSYYSRTLKIKRGEEEEKKIVLGIYQSSWISLLHSMLPHFRNGYQDLVENLLHLFLLHKKVSIKSFYAAIDSN